MEIGGDCSKYGCHEDLCCSEDKICGASERNADCEGSAFDVT